MPTSRFSRRQFVSGAAASAAVAGVASSRWLLASAAQHTPAYPATLTGSQFSLEIGEMPVNFTGRARVATVVNGSLPAPILRLREGDTVTLRVRNTLKYPSAIHWHGITLPAAMDGVPGLSFHGIEPGGSYLYQFEVRQHGTYWYHAHAYFQEQTGLYGPLIIDAREPAPFAFERDYVVMLSDWSDMAPERIFSVLKKQSGYFNLDQRTFSDFTRDVGEQGLKAALADRKLWGGMRMNPTDLSDVTGQTYTYLMNGNTPAANWTALFRRGERIRLRFINGSAMTYFDVRIPGLKMTVVAADGQYVHPVTVDEFRIANAETLDVIVTPDADEAYTVFAQSMDRTGYARGTLAPGLGMQAAVPLLDRRAHLTADDIGMSGMSGMDHSAMGHSGSMVEHPASEPDNPAVDMLAMSPVPRLDDPGIGLREAQLQKLRAGHAGDHKVLTLSDLGSLFPDPDGRDPGRTVELHLTGHMERYIFSFDGVKFSDAKPLEFKAGERLRIVLVNDTMMEHPIHLHGMWSDVEDAQGNFKVRKHTVTIPPGTQRSYRVTADAVGRWAFHCHLLYHMEAGMFREVRVT
jgi:FtsP/CotA-like multicopper oxidase with cupredoxin domain